MTTIIVRDALAALRAAPGTYTARELRDGLWGAAERISQLLSPVFFVVPAGCDDDPIWRRIIKASEPNCRCWARRVLVPLRGREDFMPAGRVILRPSADPDNPVSACVGPLGGDTTAAFALLQIDHRWLNCNEAPYRAKGSGTVHYGYVQVDRWDSRARIRLEELVALVRRRGSLTCYRTTGVGHITTPIFRVVEVRCSPTPCVVIEFDVGVAVPHGLSLAPEPHVCVGDA